MTAVSAGACLFSAFWTSKGISLTISKYAQVQISYENEINLEINKNEKKAITLDIL
jgi:hypothetical protein